MATSEVIEDEPLLRDKEIKDLQEMLREVGLDVQYWLPLMQKQLGITCVQALQNLEEKDFEKLKSWTKQPCEKTALQKFLKLSHSKNPIHSDEFQVEMIKKKQNQVQETLQEKIDSTLKGSQRQEKVMRTKKEQRHDVEEDSIECHQLLEKTWKETTYCLPRKSMQNVKRNLSLSEETLFYRQNLPDRELLRQVSGGLALQGIYKTNNPCGLIKKTEELLMVPEDLLLLGPEQGTRMELKEFSSPQAEYMFTQTIEKLGFGVTTPDKGRDWGISFKAEIEKYMHSDLKESKNRHFESSYFCLTKFNYIPLASYHFPFGQLQLSKAALQELRYIEDLLSEDTNPDIVPLWRNRTKAFFQRFGSHVNQGPLHLGGIYWWKAISEGFQSEQLDEVKQQLAEALNIYIKESYSTCGVNFSAGATVSNSNSKADSHKTNSPNLKTKIHLSVTQTGGPPEANNFCQWKFGLVSSNQTWFIIDQEFQLVPIWDIILFNHKHAFKDHLQVANCLKDIYTALTDFTDHTQDGQELLSDKKDVMMFLEDVKCWEVSAPEEQLKKLINFKQILSTNSYDIWVNICLTDWGLQNFLVNTVNFCKASSTCNTLSIKSQLRSLLEPHIYRMTNFPHAAYIMQWISQLESEQQCINNSPYSEPKGISLTESEQQNINNSPYSEPMGISPSESEQQNINNSQYSEPIGISPSESEQQCINNSRYSALMGISPSESEQQYIHNSQYSEPMGISPSEPEQQNINNSQYSEPMGMSPSESEQQNINNSQYSEPLGISPSESEQQCINNSQYYALVGNSPSESEQQYIHNSQCSEPMGISPSEPEQQCINNSQYSALMGISPSESEQQNINNSQYSEPLGISPSESEQQCINNSQYSALMGISPSESEQQNINYSQYSEPMGISPSESEQQNINNSQYSKPMVISSSESVQQYIDNSQLSKPIGILRETHNDMIEISETQEEAKTKATKVVTSSQLLNHFQETEQSDLQLSYGQKQAQDNENSRCEVKENVTFLELLQRLGLKHYYPKKMSKANFHVICKTSVYNTRPCSEAELPFYFLQKLLVLDCGLRYLVFKDDEKTEGQVYLSTPNQETKVLDPYEDSSGNIDQYNTSSVTNPRPHIHPMDIQMAILHCADDFARQYILGKLSTCQFAIPLLIPNPCNSQIEFSLWSLSLIRKSWRQGKKLPEEESNNYNNQLMYHVSAPIVSFIRVGGGFSASKSQIMNCLLSKRKHDVFFHRHSKGSTRDSLLMEGVVEICWFCPGGQEDDRFDRCVIFSNLHGDAKKHEKQLTFLREVSSLIVVLMSTSDNNEENRKLVRDLWQSSKPLICLFDDKEENIDNNCDQKVKIGIRNRNEAELIEKLTITVGGLLECSNTPLSIQDCASIALQQGFLIDEDEKDCKEAKERAETVIAVMGETKVSQIKETLLPLQGKLWHLWCKKDKELYHLTEKGNRSIEQHKSETEKQKHRIRQQQLERAFPPNDLIRSVLDILKNKSAVHTKLYFLQWLSMLMDNMIAEHLEILNKKKKSLWTQVQTEKLKAIKNNELNSWQNEIEDLSTEIIDCSLGVEHILREIGQIYEALEEAPSTKDDLFLRLPEIAAELMISGVPIELMDGEASYVPLKWVTAIFDKVSEKLGDKRLFVLSVLGLQSSGKSTLLNALFGLQFTVSAGRCTQGAYMQLLKVEETCTEEFGFDFLLVVDTEGLRAPELRNKSQSRDNELATFVIGLGNLTLINIFGENPSEMQDILQIVVQAFLRMKQVKISPSCLFVHQNVGEVTAKEQTMEGRRRLVQRLDEMTSIAAEQEHYSDITCFSDVISFNVNTQVFYFAHLWDGNPPMAPPNPRYSHNIQELKTRILTDKLEYRKSIMKISDVKLRVQDLWGALLNENFIFSFRNTREVMAMSKLETKYNSWSWELRSHVLGLHNQLINQIQNEKIRTLPVSIHEPSVTEKYEAIKQELETYFNKDTNSEILIQWKATFENKLKILKETLVSDSKKEAQQLLSFKNGQSDLDRKKAGYEKEILQRSRELALAVKDTKLSEEALHMKFNQLWETWVYNVSPDFKPAPEPTIDKDAEGILLQYFQKERDITNIIRKYSGGEFQIKHDKHIHMNRKYLLLTQKLEIYDKESIKATTDSIVSRFNETINDIKRQKCDYNPIYFFQFLGIIEEEVKSLCTHERYTLTSRYKIDLALSLFQTASKKFKEIHREFKRANDPTIYLESKKSDFFMSFKISCQGATSIKAFVDFLWEKLIPAISETVWKKMVLNIAGDIRANCPEFSGNRSNLEKYILISLAEEESYYNYYQYLYHPKPFFNTYIENCIRRYFSEKGSEQMKTFLKIDLEYIKNVILRAITDSTKIDTDKSCTVSEWLDLFCDHLGSDLIFPRKDLLNIDQEIKDFEFLKEAMTEALDPSMNKVEQNESKSAEDMVPEISKMLSEHLCGCWKQCPFCSAICTNTIPNHDGDHSVPFHRPQGIIGWHYHKTDKFTISFCTSSVASDGSFILSDDRTFPYKNYRLAGGEYATWSITPDTSTQPYWKWFVCRFRSNLEETHQKRFQGLGEIPDEWTVITKEDVLDDLKKQ